ncbi:MAG: hypothetical protein HY561_03430 [Gemmatimonadetes bacterium]|nr:hypothetical protein [Gemmatimonadota bacterium]
MPKQFTDDAGRAWVATAREEATPRHHGRWVLIFRPAADASVELPLPEVRWQTLESAERTVRTMSLVELRRRLRVAATRASRIGEPATGTPLAGKVREGTGAAPA